MTDPMRLDAFTLSDDTDFVALARGVLLGRIGGGRPQDMGPVDWLFRAYPELDGSPYQERLSEAVAVCLTDADPKVRGGALSFFEKFPGAKGAGRILALAEGDRALFQEGQLGVQLMHCVGTQIYGGVPKARDLGRREALSPGDPFPLIAALTRVDPDWVAEHAEAIVTATPTTGLPILFNMQAIGRDILALGRRIAPVAKKDRRFGRGLDRYIRDDDVRAAIRTAMRRRSR